MENKIMLVAWAESGKDFVAEYLHNKFGLKYKGSSELAAEIFIFDKLKDKYDYANFRECFEDRVNHRSEWYDLICKYNKDDPTRLATEIFERVDCYTGIRNFKELEACKQKWPEMITVWIDSEERVGKESTNSCTVTKQQSDFIIDNNGTIPQLYSKLDKIGKLICL